MEDFKHLQKVVNELNATNSINDKKEILAKYKNDAFICKVLYYTYNPFYQYYVTPATLEKNYEDDLGTLYNFTDLFDMLDALRLREVTGHKAINSVNDFCWRHEDYRDLIYKIIGKDLEIRMGDSLINKVIPGLIPTFDVALATDFEKVKVDFDNETWLASRKLDGVRCLSILESNAATAWSRQGNEFETLQNVIDELKSLQMSDVVFDGEICLVDANGDEDFQGIMKQIRRKDHTIANPKYLIFDIIDKKDFDSQKGTTVYSKRYERLKEIFANRKFQYLELVEQVELSDINAYNSLMLESDAKGWEGLILRRDVGYEGKRSKNMLKCKKFYDAEYKVIDLEIGPFRLIENGLEVTKEILTNVIIEHRGNTVSVGSGFTISEREYFKNHPDELLNKIITVKYFEETQNQAGKWSLRFPTVKVIHGVKRTV